jgi:hypothetical protein
MTTRQVAHRLRDSAAARAEEALAELPVIARRIRTLLLVVSISIPVFIGVLAVVAWRLVH